MEGLIPNLLHAMKKQEPQNSYQSLSEGSNRSYHLLLAADSFNGSSHWRTRSELQPPAVEQRPDLEFASSHSSNKGSAPSSSWGGSYTGQDTKRAANNFTGAERPGEQQ